MTKTIIDNLVDDLSPVKPFETKNLFLIAITSFVIVLAIVIVKYGMREDFDAALLSGAIAFKNGSLALGVLASIFAIDALSRPIEKKLNLTIVIFGIVGFFIFYKIMGHVFANDFIKEITNINFGGASACLSVILLGGIAVFAILWNFWLKKTASIHPRLIGAFTGAASGLISAFAYSFHCNMDGVFYFLICYWLPILSLATLGAITGNRLRW